MTPPAFAQRAWHLHLWLLKFQVFPVLNGEINMLQDDADTLLVGAIERQEANHAVIIDLNGTHHRQSIWREETGSAIMNLILLLLFRIWELTSPFSANKGAVTFGQGATCRNKHPPPTKPQIALVNFLNRLLLSRSVESSREEYMSGSRYLEEID